MSTSKIDFVLNDSTFLFFDKIFKILLILVPDFVSIKSAVFSDITTKGKP